MKLSDAGSVDFLGMKLTLRSFTGVVQERAARSSAHIEASRNLYGNLSHVNLVAERGMDI